ncbi:unnamed protein product [Chrysoparadoxa australica]
MEVALQPPISMEGSPRKSHSLRRYLRWGWGLGSAMLLCLYCVWRHPALAHLSRYPPALEEDALMSVEEGCVGRRMLKESQEPTRGILWLYHIPKTGGTAINRHILSFLKKRARSAVEVPLLQFWDEKGIGRNHSLPNSEGAEALVDYCEAVLDEIEEWLNQPPSPEKPLLIVHHHIACGGFKLLAPIIKRFRRKINSQGGALHLSTMLRQPLAQMVSRLTYNGHLTIQSMEEALLTQEYCDNSQVRFFLYDNFEDFPKELMELYWKELGERYDKKFGVYRLDDPDAEEENERMRQVEEYPPLSGINTQHVVTALEYLDDMFDFVGQTEQLLEFLDELKAFIGRFVDTSAWPSKETRVNAQGVDWGLGQKRDITSWGEAPLALKGLLIRHTCYDAALREEAMKLKKTKLVRPL